MRHPQTILTLTYEEMISDIRKVIRRVADFLQINVNEEHVEWVVEKTSFNSMKNNRTVNYTEYPNMDQSVCSFIRKGQVGDWKNYFTAAQNEWMDNEINRKLEHSDITFTYH